MSFKQSYWVLLFVLTLGESWSTQQAQSVGVYRPSPVNETAIVFKNAFTQLKKGGAVAALRTMANAIKNPEDGRSPGGYINQSDVMTVAAHLIGLGQLPKSESFGYGDSNGLHNPIAEAYQQVYATPTPPPIGISNKPEAMNSNLRAEMVSFIHTFNNIHHRWGESFYHTIAGFLKDSHRTAKEKGHLTAILNYIHADRASRDMAVKGDGVLRVPNIQELQSLETLLSASNVKQSLHLDGLKTIDRTTKMPPRGQYPTIRSLYDLVYYNEVLMRMNLDLAHTLVCIDIDSVFPAIDIPVQQGEQTAGLALQSFAQNLSENGAALVLLRGKQYASVNDIKTIDKYLYNVQIAGTAHVSQNNTINAQINPVAESVSTLPLAGKTLQQPLSNGAYYVNNWSTPVLFAPTHKGTAIAELMNRVARVQPPFTIVMVDKDKTVLEAVQRELESRGFTFVGIQLQLGV